MTGTSAFLLPFGAAALAAFVALVCDGLGRPRAGATLAAAALLAASMAAGVAAFQTDPEIVWGAFLVGAGFSGAACLIFLLAAASAFGLSDRSDARAGTLAALVALAAIAAAALAASSDRVMMLIALEALAVLGYAIVAAADTPAAAEAAMKYFVQGTIATAIYLLALAARLAAGGALTGKAALAGNIAAAGVATVSSALILVAFSFKLGAFPFHAWAPDAYDNAPSEGAAFLSSAGKVAAFVALFSVLVTLSEPSGINPRVRVLVAVVSAGSIIFGNLAALAQKRYGRMLAFSGIAQVGYGLLAVATGNGRALLLFAAGYALAVSGAFLAAGVFRAQRPEWDGSIAGLAGIARETPAVSASVSVMLLSTTGIPPLLGFWGKFLIFLNAASTDLVWLVVLAVLGSVVSFGYYGRVIRVMYFEDATPDDRRAILDDREAVVTTRRTEVAVVVLALLIVLLGAYLLVGGLAPAVGTNQVYGALQLLPFAQQ